MAKKAQDALSEESAFIGHADVTLDAKNRISVPETFTKVLKSKSPDNADKVGLVPTPDRSLRLLAYEDFMKEVEYWRNLNPRVSAQRTFRNFHMRLAKIHALDSQRRIRLTAPQVAFCELQREAILTGDIDWMQLYSPGHYQKALEKELADFSAASDEVARELDGPRDND